MRKGSLARSSLTNNHFLLKMGLWSILEGFLLLANAMAILNEDRFLAPREFMKLNPEDPKLARGCERLERSVQKNQRISS
ncbi:uncharacterized protein LOC108461836 isoform X2 [Gossypium arboreum]|uniref:uncharacterized protein LOC108461836 isoform X2 n=1 Tax=Gossypium arboreum TaxID=29729 RepID=UPI0022F1AA2C|nr:uncharacterized protein LOC108461836 isoform X2 [Gossypium arboreum]